MKKKIVWVNYPFNLVSNLVIMWSNSCNLYCTVIFINEWTKLNISHHQTFKDKSITNFLSVNACSTLALGSPSWWRHCSLSNCLRLYNHSVVCSTFSLPGFFLQYTEWYDVNWLCCLGMLHAIELTTGPWKAIRTLE